MAGVLLLRISVRFVKERDDRAKALEPTPPHKLCPHCLMCKHQHAEEYYQMAKLCVWAKTKSAFRGWEKHARAPRFAQWREKRDAVAKDAAEREVMKPPALRLDA